MQTKRLPPHIDRGLATAARIELERLRDAQSLLRRAAFLVAEACDEIGRSCDELAPMVETFDKRDARPQIGRDFRTQKQRARDSVIRIGRALQRVGCLEEGS